MEKILPGTRQRMMFLTPIFTGKWRKVILRPATATKNREVVRILPGMTRMPLNRDRMFLSPLKVLVWRTAIERATGRALTYADIG